MTVISWTGTASKDSQFDVGRKITEKIDAVLDEMNKELTDEERTSFYRSLAVISDSLEAISNRLDERE